MMNYIYSELQKAVEKVTYEGKESQTAAVIVDNENNTITVSVINVPAGLINPNISIEAKEGRYILIGTLENRAITYRWATIEDFLAKIESDNAAIYTRIDNEAQRTNNMINQLNENVSGQLGQLNQNLVDAINTINGGIATEIEERKQADSDLNDRVDKEIDRATEAEKTLNDKIEAETERAESAENSLSGRLTQEIKDREQADTNIVGDAGDNYNTLGKLEDAIQAVVNNASAGYNTLYDTEQRIKEEVSAREEAVQAEASTRESAIATAESNAKSYTDSEFAKAVKKTGETSQNIGGTLNLQDVNINGSLHVNGTTTTTETETLLVKDNIIVVNSDGTDLETAAAGIGIRTGNADTFGIVYVPNADNEGNGELQAGVGTLDANNAFSFNAGEGSPVALRDSSDHFTGGHLVEWDAAAYKMVDSGVSASDVVRQSDLDAIETSVNDIINNSIPDLEGEIANITNGTTAVGKATADGNGNNIASTYATQQSVNAIDGRLTTAEGEIDTLTTEMGQVQEEVNNTITQRLEEVGEQIDSLSSDITDGTVVAGKAASLTHSFTVGDMSFDGTDDVSVNIGNLGAHEINVQVSGGSSIGTVYGPTGAGEIIIPAITGQTGAAAGFGTPTTSVSTLDPGSDATASVTVNASSPNTAKIFDFTFGIPRGEKGDKGDPGSKGDPGDSGADGTSAIISSATASISGTVGTPTVEVTLGGNAQNRTFNFAFNNLKGEKGDEGPQGNVGPTGPQGERGPAGSDGAPGATGPVGPTGATGAQGPIGPTGSINAPTVSVGYYTTTGATGAVGVYVSSSIANFAGFRIDDGDLSQLV